MLLANPFVSVTTTPIGLEQVSRLAGYDSGCWLYPKSMRQGIEKAADFPSPVAVQQRVSCPSRIAEISLSWTICSPFVHRGISFWQWCWWFLGLEGPASGVWPSFGDHNTFEVIWKAKKSVFRMHKGKILLKIVSGYEGSRPLQCHFNQFGSHRSWVISKRRKVMEVTAILVSCQNHWKNRK